MRLFTKQFTKDLIISVIFLTLWYGITHNPIARPIAQPTVGLWSIELRQHPLVFGIAGHNYLVLRNGSHDIVEELHGLATDPATGTWKYIGDKKSDILQVWHFNGQRDYIAEKSFPGITLREGDEEYIRTLWSRGEQCINPINEERTPYPPLGVSIRNKTENSNSVAYTLILCMGLDPRHLGLITPGSKNNLLSR